MNARTPGRSIRLGRRRLLRGVGAAAGAGLLAGCLGGDDYDEAVYEGEAFVDDEPDYGGALVDVDYPGTVDWTDAETGTVYVGAGGGLDFAPAAVRIEAGTTVVWEWTGDGGPHDVVESEGAFESRQTASEGHAFEHAFEERGLYVYVCRPHERQGMKGAVEVV